MILSAWCTQVIDARRGAGLGALSGMHISTCCASRDLVAVGGFCGELAVKRLGDEDHCRGSSEFACACAPLACVLLAKYARVSSEQILVAVGKFCGELAVKRSGMRTTAGAAANLPARAHPWHAC